MRISDLDVIPSGEGRRLTAILKLTGDDGRIGLAEARTPDGVDGIADRIARMRSSILGVDPSEHPSLARRLLASEPGRPGSSLAKAATLVEIAACGLAAVSLGVAMSRLLGGAVRDRVAACATEWEPDGWTTESLTHEASRIIGLGFRTLRFRPIPAGNAVLSSSDIVRATRVCEAVRATVGPDVGLWIDFGGLLNPVDAGRLARSVERIEPTGIVNPVDPSSRARLAWLAERTRLAVGIDGETWDVRDVLDRSRLAGVASLHIDPTETSGLGVFRTLAALADADGLGFVVRGGAGVVSDAVALQLAACLPVVRHVEMAVPYPQDESRGRIALVNGDVFIAAGLQPPMP